MEVLKGSPIGQGGFGVVYRGLVKQTGVLVAIKEVRLPQDTEVDTAIREFDILRRLDHPNVVRFVAFARPSTTTGSIVMEYCPGGSLHKALHEFGGLPDRSAAHFTRQLLTGVGYLHQNNIVHRDIKPANLLLDATGKLKVADFGASKLLTDVSATTTGMLGTPFYMSPELIKRMKATEVSDVWAVGCTVLEMLRGQRPWSELGPIPLVSLVFHIGSGENVPALPDNCTPEALDFLQSHTLTIDPTQRSTIQDLHSHPFVALEDTGGEDEGVPPPQVAAIINGAVVAAEAAVDISGDHLLAGVECDDRSPESITMETYSIVDPQSSNVQMDRPRRGSLSIVPTGKGKALASPWGTGAARDINSMGPLKKSIPNGAPPVSKKKKRVPSMKSGGSPSTDALPPVMMGMGGVSLGKKKK